MAGSERLHNSQLTELRITQHQRCLAEFLHQHLAAAIPVVLALACFRQPVGIHLNKSSFDEPVHGARGEHKDALQAHSARPLFNAFQNLFAIALTL